MIQHIEHGYSDIIGMGVEIQQQDDMELVAEAANWVEALTPFRQLVPDFTLMDLQMPEMPGVDATKAIRAEFPYAKIVILTTYSGDVQASRALKVGGEKYVLKGMSSPVIFQAAFGDCENAV